MLVPELKSPQRHPPSPKELGETEVKSREIRSFDLVKEECWFFPSDLRMGTCLSEKISIHIHFTDRYCRIAAIILEDKNVDVLTTVLIHLQKHKYII